MQVIKRNGKREEVKFDKITARIHKLSYGLDSVFVDSSKVAMKVIEGVYDGVTTSQLDDLAAETAASMTPIHPDYAKLASRIAISNLHKNTEKNFSVVMHSLYNYISPKTGEKAPLLADDVYEVILNNAELLDSTIIYDRDFNFEYFGFKTLERAYLLKINGEVAERPQHMYMRVAVGIHKDDIENVIKTYHRLSEGWYTHATPTLFNAGTPNPQMSSCFLLTTQDDSIEGIFNTLKQCAQISQTAGGIGLSIHNVRATGSYIRGTNGVSNGIVPMLKVFNDTARYVDQGGGKRKGSFAVYLEPWHADVMDFLDLKKNQGKDEMRARDLFYALWIPDLFMKRVKEDGEWSLFCPNEAKGLADCYGDVFEDLYVTYEQANRARKVIKARELWTKILEAQIETGNPYMLYKDACNMKSNQKNLGTIHSSNLCTEIIEYTSPDEVAVCNLASIALPKYVTDNEFDHQALFDATYEVTLNLNKIIDYNYYPVKEARNSNMRHRPIGIGVQGLADAFIMLRMPFDSAEAKKLNAEVFETIYFASLVASKDLAKKDGHYQTYPGSPVSQGILQYDMWNVTPSPRWDWADLKAEIKKHGVRNSLLLAPMPTASTAQILGNNECFEPYTSNIYTRQVLSGNFVVVNKHLLKDLVELNLWNQEMKDTITRNSGSIQNIASIPQHIKDLYKTVWEISQKTIIEMAADRGAFIDQSQSLNLFMENPNAGKLTSMHFYAWEKGLKTGMYYLHTKAASKAAQFTVTTENERVLDVNTAENVAYKKQTEQVQVAEVVSVVVEKKVEVKEPTANFMYNKPVNKIEMTAQPSSEADIIACSLDNPDGCLMCGS